MNIWGNMTNYNTLAGVELRVAALDDRDYVHRMQTKVYSNGTVEFVGGIGLQLLEALQYSLRFRYLPVETDNWIGRHPNGSLSGLTAQIMNGEADIALSQASMHFGYKNDAAVFRQPDASTAKDIIISTFTLEMWIGWLIVWGFILMSVFFMAFLIRRVLSSSATEVFHFDTVTGDGGDDDNHNGSIPAEKVKYVDVVLWCFSQISSQGWYEIPREVSIRGIFITSMIFAYVVNIFFSAALTSNLASETISIKTYTDLMNSKLKLYGDKRLPVVYDIVKKAFSDRKEKFGDHEVSTRFVQVANAPQLILREAAAFIAFEDTAKSVFQRQGYSDPYFCGKISTLDDVIAGTPLNAMFVKKGSPLREVFNRKILVCIETGIIFRINEEYRRNTIVTCEKISSNYRGGLGVLDVFSAVFVLFVGIALCCLAFIVEKLMNNAEKMPFMYEF